MSAGTAKVAGRRGWAWQCEAALVLVASALVWALLSNPTCLAWLRGRAGAKESAGPQLRKIQDVRVGDRMRVDEEVGEHDLSLGEEVDPATWQLLELRATKKDGSWAEVVLLRPDVWVQERGARAGGRTRISVPECGIDGEAEVLAVRPCPPIKPGNGRVVTGTFKHTSARVIDLQVEGQESPIGTTTNHPFWSEDRQRFVAAGDLRVGETLRAGHGTPRLRSVMHRPKTEAVYNLEVQGSHVYHVSLAGVLVHNGGPNDRIPLLPDGYGLGQGKTKGDGRSVIYEIRGKIGEVEQFHVGSASIRDRMKKPVRYENARNLILNGKDVTITVREIDYSGIEEIMKRDNISEKEARKRITLTAEHEALEAAKARRGVVHNGGSGTKNGKDYLNLNKPGKGTLIGITENQNKPTEYVRDYGGRLSHVRQTINVCP